MQMLAVTLMKLLVMSIAIVGLVRLVVIALIGDAENDLAIRRFIHSARQARRRTPEECSKMKGRTAIFSERIELRS
jgi:hypothetical protein